MDINWWLLLISPIVCLGVGFVWYMPQLLGKIWQKEVGLSDDVMKKGPGAAFGVAAAASIVAGFAFAFLDKAYRFVYIIEGQKFEVTLIERVWRGGLLGLIVGIGLISTSLVTNYVFARRSVKLTAIDCGYMVVYFLLLGLISGIFNVV